MRTLTRRQRTAAIVLAVIALLFISLDFAGGSLRGARGGVTGALGSLYRGTDGVMGPTRRFIQGVPDVGRNRADIARLQSDNADLRRQLAAATADAGTASQLKKLQLQAATAGLNTMPARVVATGPGSGFQWTVTVDVGSREHVLVGQTVTDGVGLVGRVVAVYPTTSVILLAADPTSGVGVRDTRSGDLLLANGLGSAGLSAASLGDNASVKVGDQLVTGPVGDTTFVSGIAVGTVASVTTTGNGSLRLAVRPSAGQTSLDLIGIVLSSSRGSARTAIGPGSDR
ncbi:MAG TPA: rod shape-determining protein MreC [Jatrophihabitans sp.]|jgi:rod shape-determining protein MreC